MQESVIFHIAANMLHWKLAAITHTTECTGAQRNEVSRNSTGIGASFFAEPGRQGPQRAFLVF